METPVAAAQPEAWELSKENYVPVKSGRKKAALAETADPADSSSKQALEAKRKELWREIREYKGGDPIEPWQKLVKWTQEHLTGGKAELQKVLESCTSELIKQERYLSDIRFLRIWIQYADCLPDPNDVFLYLKEKQIGLEFALFFEAYATYYELRGNCAAADAVYQDGLNRGARPVDRLKQKYAAFQTRMAQRIQRKIQDDALVGPAPEEQRGALAPMVPTAAARGPAGVGLAAGPAAGSSLLGRGPQPLAAPTGPSLLGISRPAPQAGAGLASMLQPQASQQAPAARPFSSLLAPAAAAAAAAGSSARGPVPVAVDDEFQPGAPKPGGLLPGYATMPQGVANLKDLKPYGVIRKENNEKPAMWAGSALPQAPPSVYASAGPPKLEICVDDEFQEGDEEPASAQPQGPSFRQLVEGSGAPPPAASASSGLGLGGGTSLLGMPGAPQQPQSSLLQPQGQPRSLLLSGLGSAQPPLGQQQQAAPPLGRAFAQLSVGPAAAEASGAKSSLLNPAGAGLGVGTGAGLAARPSLLGGALQPQRAGLAPSGPAPTQPSALAVPPAASSSKTEVTAAVQPSAAAPAAAADHSGEMSFEEIRAAAWLKKHGPLPPRTTAATATTALPTCAPAPVASQQPAAQARSCLAPGPEQQLPPAQAQAQPERPHTALAALPAGRAGTSRPALGVLQPRPALAPVGPAAPVAPAAAPADPVAALAATLVQARQPALEPMAQQQAAPATKPARRPLGCIAVEAPAPAAPVLAPPPVVPAAPVAPAASCMAAPAMTIPCDDDFFAGPTLPSHSAVEPTITISTQAAFAAMNDIFGGAGSGAAAGAAAYSHDAAADYHQHPPAEPPAAKRHHHEPTVTINTRAAFDALNDMFSGPQPSEAARRQQAAAAGQQQPAAPIPAYEDMAKMPSLPASVKPISALDVCRLANKSKALGGGRPSLAPQGPGGLAIHEDTEFIRPLTAMDTGMASGAGAGMSMNMGGNGRSSSRGRRSSVGLPGLGGFAIHEDTDFIGIQPPPHGAPGARQGLGMGMGHQPLDSMANNNDDTVCVGLGLSQGQMGIAGGHMQQAPSAGLGLYEDTEFITGKPMAMPLGVRNVAPAPAAAPGGLLAAQKQPLGGGLGFAGGAAKGLAPRPGGSMLPGQSQMYAGAGKEN